MTNEREFRRAVLEGNAQRAGQHLASGVSADVAFAGNATALHHAAGSGKVALVRVLLERGAAVDARDSSGATPLHWAACIGNFDTAKLLLDHGGDVNACTHSMSTPLHRATRYGRIDVVRLLLERGANRDAKDANELTPLDIAMNSQQESPVKEALLTLLGDDKSLAFPPPSPADAKRARSGTKRAKPRQR